MKTILYIDDDLDDIHLFKDVIHEIDPAYTLQTFSESKTALSFLEETSLKPDIIFLDINMPQLSGKETLLLIRRNKLLATVPVIMYSTSIYGADSNMFIQLGANDFLKKAGDFNGMVKEVSALLQQFLK